MLSAFHRKLPSRRINHEKAGAITEEVHGSRMNVPRTTNVARWLSTSLLRNCPETRSTRAWSCRFARQAGARLSGPSAHPQVLGELLKRVRPAAHDQPQALRTEISRQVRRPGRQDSRRGLGAQGDAPAAEATRRNGLQYRCLRPRRSSQPEQLAGSSPCGGRRGRQNAPPTPA